MQHRFRSTALLAAAVALLAAAAPAWAQGTGNGLVGDYYNTNNFTGNIIETRFNEPAFPVGTSLPVFNLNYVAASPGGAVNTDNFSIRWRGQIEPALGVGVTETVTFRTFVDDQARLTINGVQVIALGGSGNGTFSMTGGQKYDIMLEYIEFGGNASIRLEWQSTSIAVSNVPTTRLYSPTAKPATPTCTPNGGAIVTPSASVSMSATGNPTIYYTTNGTDPGIHAPGVTNPAAQLWTGTNFNMTVFGRVLARSYDQGYPSDLFTSNVFMVALTDIAQPANTSGGGLYFREYTGTGNGIIPNLNILQAIQRGIVAQPTHAVPPLPPRIGGDTVFCYQYAGYINIPTSANPSDTWTFYTSSDDGSRLYIDGYLIVDNNFSQGNTERSGQVQLEPGFHTILVEYGQGGGGFTMNASWEKPGFAKAVIPASAFFTEAIVATPTLTPNGGNFSGNQNVTINSTTPGAIIYYTLDGTYPSPEVSAGSGTAPLQLNLTSTTTLRALAGFPGMNASNIASATFTNTAAVVRPAPVGASAAGTNTELLVFFDRPLNAASATTAANYSITDGVTTGPPSAVAVLDRSAALMGHWKMEFAAANPTSATDLSANGNNAVIANGIQDATNRPFTAYVNPASNNTNSLEFNGASTTFTVTNNASIEVTRASLTAAAWIRTDNVTLRQSIMGKWARTDDTQGLGWYIELAATGGATGVLHYRLQDTVAGRTIDSGNIATTITANNWFHVALRYERLTQRASCFVNGVQVGTTINASVDFDDISNTADFRVGSVNVLATPTIFDGRIDDVRIYRAELTNAEIAALAANNDTIASAVKLTTAALAPATGYTLTVLPAVTDYVGNGVANGTTIPFRYFPTGTMSYERWLNIVNGGVVDFARLAVFPNSPDFGASTNLGEFGQSAPNVDNFAARIRGFFIPPTTGNYRFAVASDDPGKLFLSPDENPANKAQISLSTGYSGGLHSYAGGPVIQSGLIALTANKKYYIEAYNKEGGGGDFVSIGVTLNDTPPLANAPVGDTQTIPGAQLAPYVDPTIILTQPASRVVNVGQSVSFTVNAIGTHTGGTRFQWKKNTVDIPGANAATYTIASAVVGDAGDYTCLVTNSINNALSAIATLTVNNISTPPTVTNVNPNQGSSLGGTNVTVTGTNFITGQTSVLFGGAAATNVIVTGPTTLTCTTPAHAAGVVTVQVNTPASQAGSLSNGFTYFDPVTITLLTPNAGKAAGGDVILITGTNFTNVTAVSFGGIAAASFTIQNATTISATTPAAASLVTISQVAVAITNPAGTTTVNNAFTYYPPPTITVVNPNSGPTTGAQTITLTGTNFATGATAVTFGGLAASNVVVVSPTSLTCSRPVAAAPAAITTVDVAVVTPGAQSFNLPTSYTYYPAPTIATITPSAGKATGGDTITITGTNFAAGQTTVSFGANLSATVVVVNPTTLTAVSPAASNTGVISVVDVTVTTPATFVTSAAAFTYYPAPTISAVTPAGGPTAGGQVITITGTNFATGLNQTTVDFGANAGTVTNVTNTTITVTSPASSTGNTSVNVVVHTPGNQQVTATNAHTYFPLPTISNISLITGPSQGGQTLTITGTGFLSGQTTVTFGSAGQGPAAAAIVTVTSTTITLTTPGHDAATVDVIVNAPGGFVNSPAAYTFSGPRITTVAPNTGPTAGGQTVTITGSGFIPGSTTLTVGGVAITPTNVTTTTITYTTPAGTAGPALDVTVTVGANPTTLVGGYTYINNASITSIAPNQGPTAGGQTVIITGTNFSSGFTTVTIGGVAATGINVTGPTSLTCITPANAAGNVPVVVTVFGITATGTVTYDYLAPPTITSIVPNRGPQAGGQSVTILGTGFSTLAGQTAVTFGGTPATGVVVAAGGTSLTCVAPAHAAGAVTVSVTTFATPPAGNSAPPAGGYTYVNPAATIDLSLTNVPSNSSPGINSVITFNVAVNNAAGGIAATNVIVFELLPAGLQYISSVASVGTYDAASGLWNVGGLAAGAGATLQITARVTSASTINVFAEVANATELDLDSTPSNGVAGEDDQQIATVTAGLALQTAAGSLGTATVGAPFTRQIVATGGVPNYTWTLAANPDTPPLSFNGLTGTLSGIVPSTAALQVYTFDVTVADSAGATQTRTYSILVTAPTGAAPIVDAVPLPPAGVVGVPYSYTFTAHDGVPPYAFSSTGTLPPGLTLNSQTGTLAGTPTTTAGSPFNFSITATGPGASAPQAFSVAVTANPVTILTTSVSDSAIGEVYEQYVIAQGGLGPNFTWTVISGAPPTGVTPTPLANQRVLSLIGSPTNSGTFNFTVRVTDVAGGATATQSFLVNVAGGGASFFPTSPTSIPTGTMGQPYDLQLTSLGGTPSITWTITGGSLPNGLSMSTSGSITGTPLSAGVFAITVRGTAGNGQSGSQTISINIAPPPSIASATPLPQAVGTVGYFTQLQASGGAPPLRWTSTAGMPTGLSLNLYSGAISGIPTAAGATFDVTVTDANGATDVSTFTIPFVTLGAGPLTILGSLPPAHAGVPYSATLQATGGTGPYTFALVGTAGGLTFDAVTHTLSGTPDNAAIGVVQVQVTDSAGPPATALSNALVKTVPLDIQQATLNNGSLGSAYNETLTVVGATAPVVWTLVSGSLPAGLSLDSAAGTITGTLSAAGTSTFQIQATDALGQVSQQQFTVTVSTGSSGTSGGGGGGGGGGCGLLGLELLLLYALRRRSRT